MFYDTIKMLVNNTVRNIYKFKRCSISLIYVFKKLKESGKTFLFMNTTPGWFFWRFNNFFNCSSILTLGIRIADWGGLLSRSGLHNIYKLVIKNFSHFFRVDFMDSAFFKSNAIISYDSSLVKKDSIAFQNGVFLSVILVSLS